MQDTARELYAQNRANLPYAERNIFNLPLRLRLKQGSQQLRLWIQRVSLLFKTYAETPITINQQTRITEWLNEWDNTMLPTTVTQDATDTDSAYTDTRSMRENTDTEREHSQTNITNWLKSWSQVNSTQDSDTVLGEDLSTSLGF